MIYMYNAHIYIRGSLYSCVAMCIAIRYCSLEIEHIALLNVSLYFIRILHFFVHVWVYADIDAVTAVITLYVMLYLESSSWCHWYCLGGG